MRSRLAVGVDPGGVTFTSGGTEADNLAVLGALGGPSGTGGCQRRGASSGDGGGRRQRPGGAGGAGRSRRSARPGRPCACCSTARWPWCRSSWPTTRRASSSPLTKSPVWSAAGPRARCCTPMPSRRHRGSIWRVLAGDADLIAISGHKFGGPQGVGRPGRPGGIRPCAPSCTAGVRSGSCAAAPTTWPASSAWASRSRWRRRPDRGSAAAGCRPGATTWPAGCVEAIPGADRDGRRRAPAARPSAPARSGHRERGSAGAARRGRRVRLGGRGLRQRGAGSQPGPAGHGRTQGGRPFEPPADPGRRRRLRPRSTWPPPQCRPRWPDCGRRDRCGSWSPCRAAWTHRWRPPCWPVTAMTSWASP